MDLISAIERRHSIRRYERDPVPKEIVQQVIAAGQDAVPLHSEIAIRWYVVWNGGVLAQCLTGLSGVYGMFTSAPHYIIAVSEERPGFMENVGFCMEQLVLAATDMGLGTCWIGGLFTEEKLSKFVPDRSADERIIAITPLGYADRSQQARMARQLIRWGTDRHGRRKPVREMVSQDIWAVPWEANTPLNQEQAQALPQVFELTRLAPSWANIQPWHFIVDDQEILALVNSTRQKGNVREGKPYYRLDGGIAMCHFYLATQAAGWTEQWHAPRNTQAQMRARYGIPEEYVVLGTFPRPVR